MRIRATVGDGGRLLIEWEAEHSYLQGLQGWQVHAEVFDGRALDLAVVTESGTPTRDLVTLITRRCMEEAGL